MLSINVNGRLLDLSSPKVMGIVNVTPDSFYTSSRVGDEAALRCRVEQMRAEGADMIDIGACSTRPGADTVAPDEEMKRLEWALKTVCSEWPEAIISVDTFRSEVAKMSVEEYGAAIVNDISAGDLDGNMFDTVARMRVPYIIMHMKGRPATMQQAPKYDDVVSEVVMYLAGKVAALRERGVADIIIDPGFGFGKTLEHNYELLAHLSALHELECPLLVGMSRKSMVYRLLEQTPEEALNGTTVVNTMALLQGANILRVHDVRAAMEAVRICEKMKEQQ